MAQVQKMNQKKEAVFSEKPSKVDPEKMVIDPSDPLCESKSNFLFFHP